MSPTGVTLVLSGGGARTAAHLGAVWALREASLDPVRYLATSMGAVIGAGLAAGVPEDELLLRLAEVGRRGIVRDPLAPVAGLFLRSLLKPAPLRRAIATLVPASSFAELRRPLTVCVVDLDSGELMLFGAHGSDAPLLDVLCASCALPLYFPSQILQGRRCGDGGLRGVLPLEVAARLAQEPVVAVDVGPGFDMAAGQPYSAPSLIQAHEDAVGTLMATNTAAHLALWYADPKRPSLIYIRPRVERNATFRVDRVRQYAEDGYRAARDSIAKWRGCT